MGAYLEEEMVDSLVSVRLLQVEVVVVSDGGGGEGLRARGRDEGWTRVQSARKRGFKVD